MGASNVSAVFTYWAELSHRELRALVYMALISMDQDTPPVYFGGWESLAGALGLDCQAKPDGARRVTSRVMQSLGEAGAVVSSGQARPGVRAEYALALHPETTYKPQGEGRGVTWVREQRTPEPATAPVAPPATAPVAPPATAPVAPPATAPVRDLRPLRSETYDRSDHPKEQPQEQHQEQQDEYIEDQSSVGSFVSPTREVGNVESDEINLPISKDDKARQERADSIKADTPKTIDAERLRQSQALVKMQAEYERNLALEETA